MHIAFSKKKFLKLLIISSLILVFSYVTQNTSLGYILGMPFHVFLSAPAIFLEYISKDISEYLFFSTQIFNVHPNGILSWIYILFFWFIILLTLSILYGKNFNKVGDNI
jgi:hypothetical protein